jgi:hypothetical protein
MICLSTSIHVCGTRVNAKGSTLGKQGNQAEKCTQFNRLCANVAEGRRTRLRGDAGSGRLKGSAMDLNLLAQIMHSTAALRVSLKGALGAENDWRCQMRPIRQLANE